MYQKNQLGFIDSILGAAGSLFGGGGGGGGGGSMPVTVSPNISTQVSPQISPIFQQQFQPQNSAATAGTAQSLPGMPIAPGQSAPGLTLPASGIPMPTPVNAQADYVKYMPYALAALGILAFVTLRKKGAQK